MFSESLSSLVWVDKIHTESDLLLQNSNLYGKESIHKIWGEISKIPGAVYIEQNVLNKCGKINKIPCDFSLAAAAIYTN